MCANLYPASRSCIFSRAARYTTTEIIMLMLENHFSQLVVNARNSLPPEIADFSLLHSFKKTSELVDFIPYMFSADVRACVCVCVCVCVCNVHGRMLVL